MFLEKLFAKYLDRPNPNQEGSEAIYRAEAAHRSKAFATWYGEYGGKFLIESMEGKTVGKIHKAITHSRATEADRYQNLRLLDEIVRDIQFMNVVLEAFDKDTSKGE